MVKFAIIFPTVIKYIAALLVTVCACAQEPFLLNANREVAGNGMNQLAKKRGYDLVSAFDTVQQKPPLVYAQYIKGGKIGILDIYGQEITPPIYDEIKGLDRSITPNLFAYPAKYIVKENGRYGLISNTGKKLIPPTYLYLYYRANDTMHYTAYPDKRSEITINSKGKKVTLPPENDGFETQRKPGKPETALSADGKSYHLRHYWTGKETTVPNLGNVVQNYGNTVVFQDAKHKVGLYDLDRKKMSIGFEYDEIKMGFKGYYRVKQGRLNGVLDSLGHQKIPMQYEYLDFTSGGAYGYANKKYVIFDKQMNRLSDFEFDRYGYMGEKGLILVRDGKYGLMSTEGKILVPFEYDAMETPQDHDLKFSIILARKNGKYAVMDFNGKRYTDFVYDRILPESNVFPDSRSLEPVFNGHANQPNLYHYVMLNGKWGLLDNDFKPMIKPVYDYFLESFDRSVLFAKKGKWGMIDLRTEKPIIPFVYDGAIEWKHGLYQVYQNNAYGLVNGEGKFLIPIGSRVPFNVEKVYNGLWQISNYADRTSYFLDYEGRRTQPVKWPETD